MKIVRCNRLSMPILVSFILACGLPGISPTITGTPMVSATETKIIPAHSPDMIFFNGSIITMDNNEPQAQAIAIDAEHVLAVGTNDEILALQDSSTQIIDLQGRALMPGFIDSHQHRIGDRGKRGYTNADPVVQLAIEQGWTTINELYVDEGRLNELLELDRSGVLRLRVNAYLPVMENSPEGKSFGEWYAAYNPGQVMSPRVRVAGLKIFTDFDNATILLWRQDDLNALLLKEYRKGWQLGVKTVSTRSLEMILKAFEYIESIDPNVVKSRPRLEHALFIAPEQIARVKHLGLIPVINLNNPGQLVGAPDVDALIAREPQGSYTPWRSLFEAGIPVANGTGWPSFYVDEPRGAPFGSPMHLIYQAVTRVGNLGTQPYPWLLDQTISAQQALRALTIDAAYSSYEEEVKGSLTAGKLADLVVLSDNPLSVSTAEINNIRVLMTMIDGKVEFCATGVDWLCPSASSSDLLPALAPVTASASLPDSPPSNATDGNLESVWNSGAGPEQWIQIDLGTPSAVSAIRIVISQFPAGETVHQLWVGTDLANLKLVHEFNGFTKDPDILEFKRSDPLSSIRLVRIVTTQSPSWVAWREIEIIISPDN